MKSHFIGFYPPTNDEYRELWQRALVVLDANVLLNLYRLPTVARNELLSILRLVNERIWIPHQVALEYQRNRLAVIATERKSTETALEFARATVSELKSKVNALQIDKRGLQISTEPLLLDLERANSKLVDAIEIVHKAQLEIASSDPVRDNLDEILDGRVGIGPISQAELDELCVDGEHRFANAIPPGFADAAKEKNPNEARFVHQHLIYQRRFGDLILWRQLVQHAKTQKPEGILLITGDKKEDWWWREQGKTIGPHPELAQEIRREAGVKQFWMYSAAQFMELAPSYTTAKVSTESVAELKQVANSSPGKIASHTLNSLVDYPHIDSFFEIADSSHIESAVVGWLREVNNGELVANSTGFPDVIVRSGSELHGFEIRQFTEYGRRRLSPRNLNSMFRGQLAVQDGTLTAFTLVLAMSERQGAHFAQVADVEAWRARFRKALKECPIHSIILGRVREGKFDPIAWQVRDTTVRSFLG